MNREIFDRLLIIILIALGILCLFDVTRRFFPNILPNNTTIQRVNNNVTDRTQSLESSINKVNYQSDRINAIKNNTKKFKSVVDSIPIEKSRGPYGSSYGVAKSENEFLRNRYINYLEYNIRSNWTNPTNIFDDSVTIVCSIDRNGNITNYDIKRPAKNAEFYKSALSALLSVSPFDRPVQNIEYFSVTFSGYDVKVYNEKYPVNLTYNVPISQSTVKLVSVEDAKSVQTHFGFSFNSKNTNNINHNISSAVHKQIVTHWNPPIDVDSDTIIQYVINKDGTASNISFIKKSYNDDADAAAYAAIKSIKVDNQNKSEYNSECGFTVKKFYMKKDYGNERE